MALDLKYGMPPMLTHQELMRNLRGNPELQKLMIARVKGLNDVFRDGRLVTRCEFVDDHKGFRLEVNFTLPKTEFNIPVNVAVASWQVDDQGVKPRLDVYDGRTRK